MRRRSAERLRQQRETFDQLKAHDASWFKLKFAAGASAIAVFVVTLIAALAILMDPSRYSIKAVEIVAYTLLADILALAGLVLGLVFRDASGTLRPVTEEGDDQ
jgi:predicted membrane protein